MEDTFSMYYLILHYMTLFTIIYSLITYLKFLFKCKSVIILVLFVNINFKELQIFRIKTWFTLRYIDLSKDGGIVSLYTLNFLQ